MNIYNILELQHKIEEKRLILGKRLAGFLLNKIQKTFNYISVIFADKNCAFWGSFLVVILAIFVESRGDISSDFAISLEIAAKIMQGGKYHHDFFNFSPPLLFLLTIIPVFFAKILALNAIISLKVFLNLLGILALYYSAKILAKSPLKKDITSYNLVIMGLAVGYFLPVSIIELSALKLESSYLLAALILYISYQFLQKNQLKTADHFIKGSLIAIFCCFKPIFGILVLIFELKKSKNKLFWQNLTIFLLLLSYLLLLVLYFSEYLHYYWQILPQTDISTYFSGAFLRFKDHLMPLLMLIFLSRNLVKKNQFLLIFCYFALLGIFISQQITIFYALLAPLLLLLLQDIVKHCQIDWKKNALSLLVILLIPQFDADFFGKIIFQLGAFWWIFIVILSTKYRKISAAKHILFLPRNYISWVLFIALALLINLAFIYHKYEVIAWVFSTLLLFLIIDFYQKLYEETQENITSKQKLSSLSIAVIFIVLSYIINLHLQSAFSNKAPSQIRDKMAKIIKSEVAKNEKFMVISPNSNDFYPLSAYFDQENLIPFADLEFLYKNIANKTMTSLAQDYVLKQITQNLNDSKVKLVFIDSNNSNNIGFLEYYFSNAEFREDFLQNYQFLTRFTEFKQQKPNVDFYDSQDLQILPSNEFLAKDIEVYVRK